MREREREREKSELTNREETIIKVNHVLQQRARERDYTQTHITQLVIGLQTKYTMNLYKLIDPIHKQIPLCI